MRLHRWLEDHVGRVVMVNGFFGVLVEPEKGGWLKSRRRWRLLIEREIHMTPVGPEQVRVGVRPKQVFRFEPRTVTIYGEPGETDAEALQAANRELAGPAIVPAGQMPAAPPSVTPPITLAR